MRTRIERVTQADLDAAEADARKALEIVRAFFADRASYPDAQQAQRTVNRFIHLRERMMVQERRAFRLRAPRIPSGKPLLLDVLRDSR